MIEIPTLVRVKQQFPRSEINDIRNVVFAQIQISGISICPGSKIAIAVGSRGIANLPEIVRSVVDWVKGQGGVPFIVPAMGSHGNGIAEEQVKILNALGISEASAGAPIRSSMETVELPNTGLNRVYFDRNAYEADGTIIINRIKIHGDFSGETESGLLKMCTIGLGKHKQALEIHQYDINRLQELIVNTARQIIAHGNLIFGVGIVESAYHETMTLQVLRPEQFEEEEKKLLQQYKRIMPKFPVEEFDILIVDEIGKEISGAGMEPKIVGRLRSGAEEPALPRIRYIVATDLTEASHGNACGVGLADFITQKLFGKIDLAATNENIVTCRCIEQGRIPLIAEDDRQAIEYSIRALGNIGRPARMIRIKNTLRMDKLYVSQCLVAEVAKCPAIAEIGERPVKIFSDTGRTLVPFDELDSDPK